MFSKKNMLGIICVLFCLTSSVMAVTPLAVPGKLLASNDLQTADPAWKNGKGSWTFDKGGYVGVENKEQHHPATCQLLLQYNDAVITFECKFVGGASAEITINAEDLKRIGGIMITPEKFFVRGYTFDGKKKTEVPFPEAKTTVSTDGWIKVTLAVVGNELQGCIGDECSYGTLDRFTTPKGNILLMAGGDGIAFRNVRVYEATRNPVWVAPTK